MIRRATPSSVLAKFKEKLKSEEGNDIYVYSERQISLREKKKAERIEALRGKLDGLRKQVKKDLSSDDPKTARQALAVALIDHTYERVGNDESAEERGHFGVTGWRKSHVTFSGKGATIKYVGKSGVKHDKKVTDAALVKALKAACEDCDGEEGEIFKGKDVRVTAREVNDYLKDFDVTAKDLRGLHANQEVLDRLEAIRKKGPELPRARKDRDKILKKEFKQAVEEAAEAVGHEPSTLRSQYLVPGVEEAYLHDGSVPKKFTDRKSAIEGEAPPLAFADRVLGAMISAVVGSDVVIASDDYTALRVAYRRLGGSWEALWHGDPASLELAKGLVAAWGQSPRRKKVPTHA
jgi:DNA topoisomerase I